MSYSADPLLNFGPGSADEDELRKALIRRQQYVLGNTPAGVIAGVSPVGETEEGKTTYGAPGIGNMVYSGLAGAARWLTNLGLKAGAAEASAYTAPYTGEQVVAPQITPEMTGEKAAEDKLQEQLRLGTRLQARVAPPPVPETREDLIDAEVGKQVGLAAIPIPGVAYTRLPSVVAAPLKFIAPTVKEAPFVGAAVGGTGYMMDASAAQEAEKQRQQEAQKPQSQTSDYTPGVIKIDLSGGQAQPRQEQPTSQQPQQQQPASSESGWTLPEVGLAAGASMAGLWALTKFGGRGLNRAINTIHNIPTDAAAVSRTLDEIRAGRGSASVRGGDIPEMPLPGNAGDYTHRWSRDWLNPNAVLNQTARGITGHVDEAESLIGHNNTVNYPAGQARQMESQFRTGISPTGRQGPSQYDMKTMVDAMSDGQRQIANDAAWARNELDNRKNNGGRRVGYSALDDLALQQMVHRGENDPLTRAFLTHINATQRFMVDDMMRMGVVSRSEAAHALATNPNFMPTFDVEGNLLHSWTGRNVEAGTGLERPALPAWEAHS